jgi:DNA-binding transcriptional regulator PaaX
VAARRRRDGSATEPVRWLVLVYRVPSEPTRLRAAVWRRLKSLGAIYLQNSVAALPADPKSERALRTLRNEIVQSMSGRAQLLSSVAMVGEADLLDEYNAARNDEYDEILDKCQDFHAEIEKETTVEHFTYGELEENEEDLAKLLRWHEKVRERDVFGASGGQAVREALETCRIALDEYARRVYEVDSAAY